MKKLHFHTSLSEKIGMVIDNNQCNDIVVDRLSQKGRLGSIYLGKVRNVDSSIDAAFIDLGMDKVGFLAKHEVPFIKKNEALSSYLTEGSRIIVQIIKESYQDKGHRLTANVTMNGNNIIYLPNGDYIAGSKKLSEQSKNKWKSFLQTKLLDNEGLILRTNCEVASEEIMIAEIEELRMKWQRLQQVATEKKPPVLLFEYPLIPDQMINQYQSYLIEDITFDDYKVMKDMQSAFPSLAGAMRVRKNANEIRGRTFTQWLDEAIQPVVKKEDGITLTIEETEALTVIDIDSSGFRSHQNKENTMFFINQKAVGHCADEIRKRNISGIILIDFLKMKKKEEFVILNKLKEKFKEDPIRTEVFGFTRLGLVEMTRKRERKSLLPILTDQSHAYVKTVETIGYQLERELIDWNQANIEALIITCHTNVYQFISRFLKKELMDKLSYTLYVQIDDHEKEYSIIRSGSMELIALYMRENQHLVIDMLQ